MSPGTLHNEELKHRDSSKLHKRKKPPSSRFFDLDTSGDSISLDMRKPKHLGFKRKKQKRLLEPRGSLTSEVKQKRIKKRRTKGSIGIDFKKQARLIHQQKKAVRLASIDDTIAAVIEPMEGDKEDENEKNIQDKTKKNMQDLQE